jgi:hypothetical protein
MQIAPVCTAARHYRRGGRRGGPVRGLAQTSLHQAGRSPNSKNPRASLIRSQILRRLCDPARIYALPIPCKRADSRIRSNLGSLSRALRRRYETRLQRRCRIGNEILGCSVHRLRPSSYKAVLDFMLTVRLSCVWPRRGTWTLKLGIDRRCRAEAGRVDLAA